MKSIRITSIFKRTMLVLCSLLVVNAAPTYAQFTNDAMNAINNGYGWYDPNFGGCTTGGSTPVSGLTGNDNVQQAYNFFVGMGLTNFQSAGIVGNLMWESGGVNPTSHQKGGPGTGIAQWSNPGRWNDLVSWVSNPKNFPDSQAHDAYTMYAQLMFLWHEMKDVPPWNKALPAVQASQTVEQATKQFEITFEKSADSKGSDGLILDNNMRIKDARLVLQQYGGGLATTNPTTGEAVSDCPVTAGGQTQYIDGFTVYNQCDPAWANAPYSSSTVCNSGCGPSAMAMAITALTGQRVTPDQTAAYAGAQGMYLPGVGSDWSIAPVVAKHWGLNATFIGPNATKITQALQAGAVIVGAGQGPLPFTSGGHYIAIRGVTADGKWMIGDSAHRNTSAQQWDPASLLAYMGGGSIYAISKEPTKYGRQNTPI
ncbi:MAG TPA: phage tail tip lysozyme [Candidatus Saccharimonadales bacterium]